MLRNTRKRLHEFFRPKNALLQFYLQADHKITEGSERAARISHIRTASARCISPARAGPYEKGPKPASSFRRSTAPRTRLPPTTVIPRAISAFSNCSHQA
jgi:hypothetical protein